MNTPTSFFSTAVIILCCGMFLLSCSNPHQLEILPDADGWTMESIEKVDQLLDFTGTIVVDARMKSAHWHGVLRFSIAKQVTIAKGTDTPQPLAVGARHAQLLATAASTFAQQSIGDDAINATLLADTLNGNRHVRSSEWRQSWFARSH